MRKHLTIIIFLSFYFLIIAYKLISHPTPLYDWDEAINVQVSKEIIDNKSLVPLWQGNPWLDKPPLPFLFFGIIMKLTPFVQPEIFLRIVSLILSSIGLIFIYALFLRVTRDKLIPLLTVLLTSFTPIFLQRSQIVNLDVFLLIGWLGYILFVQNFWLSLFFLAIGVLSKSLLGFYPLGIMFIYYSYLLISKKIKIKEFKKISLKLFSHLAILAVWYLLMLIVFNGAFWKQHIIETHFRRVASSIESHFGQRTYYIDLLFEQLGIFGWTSLLGLLFVIINSIHILKKSDDRIIILDTIYLIPWFIFLNLTKTKIFWYLYPAIPEFAFLSVYPLILLVNRHSGKRVERAHPESVIGFWTSQNDIRSIVYYGLGLLIFVFVFYQNFMKTNFFETFYSKPEDYYNLALYAKDRCDSLTVLVSKETRDSIKTLKDLGLTITSTKQWGDHPSIVYYFGKKVDFIYNKDEITSRKFDCLALNKNDFNIKIKKMNILNKFNSLYLLKNQEY